MDVASRQCTSPLGSSRSDAKANLCTPNPSRRHQVSCSEVSKRLALLCLPSTVSRLPFKFTYACSSCHYQQTRGLMRTLQLWIRGNRIRNACLRAVSSLPTGSKSREGSWPQPRMEGRAVTMQLISGIELPLYPLCLLHLRGSLSSLQCSAKPEA